MAEIPTSLFTLPNEVGDTKKIYFGKKAQLESARFYKSLSIKFTQKANSVMIPFT